MTKVTAGECSWQIVAPEHVRRGLKVLAAQRGTTLKDEVNRALARYLEQETNGAAEQAGEPERVAR